MMRRQSRRRASADWPIPPNIILAFPLCLIAALLAKGSGDAFVQLAEWMREPEIREAFIRTGLNSSLSIIGYACMLFAPVYGVASIVGVLSKTPRALSLLRKAYGFGYVIFAVYCYMLLSMGTPLHAREIASNQPDISVTIFLWQVKYFLPAALVAAVIAVLHVNSWRHVAISAYSPTAGAESSPNTEGTKLPLGDRIVENIRTHGKDPSFRKSVVSSLILHIALILLPILVQLIGCVENYRIPKGSGDPRGGGQVAQVIKVEKKKKKKLILNPNSPIVFTMPDLEDSKILKEVDELSQVTYKADPNATTGQSGNMGGGKGKLGQGGGKSGGWPNGMDKGLVRIVRIEYDGPSWDDGMTSKSGDADTNFLKLFAQDTGFKVAAGGEGHPIRLLTKYDKGYAPPFLYFTGSGRINIPAADIKILRDYLLDGGMLFADCGSPDWDRSFRSFARVLFPEEPLKVIADDDPLLQFPFAFPNGAPPLWHHGGNRAMGIKIKGRWVVFYHPGDVNDAWKTGHSGMNPELARGAYQMGCNVIHYAFTQYLEVTKKYRK